jgi:hypothetical protein
MAAKFFTGLPLDGPDPECVLGNADHALAARTELTVIPKSEVDHSRTASTHGPRSSRVNKREPVGLALAPPPRRPARDCDASPLADMAAVPVAGS